MDTPHLVTIIQPTSSQLNKKHTRVIMSQVIDILNISDVMGEESNMDDEKYGEIYNFIKTRGYDGNKKREVIIRKADMIDISDQFISSVVRLGMDISRHDQITSERMAAIVLGCCNYITTKTGEEANAIIITLEEKLERDNSRRRIVREEEKLEREAIVSNHENKLRQESAKTREAESSAKSVEATMMEIELKTKTVEYEMRRVEAEMVVQERLASAQQPIPVIDMLLDIEVGSFDKESESRDRDLFSCLDLSPVQSVTVEEPSVVKVKSSKRKTIDGEVVIAKRYKNSAIKLGKEIRLGTDSSKIPTAKSDRLAQVAMAISETGGGMDGVFSSVWGLVCDMRDEKRSYNREYGLSAPNHGVNDIISRVFLNKIMYTEKYQSLCQYVCQSSTTDDKFIQNAFSLISMQTNKFQKSFPSVKYCKLSSGKNQGALLINMVA